VRQPPPTLPPAGLSVGSVELPFAELDEGFRQRSTYQEGSLTDPPDLSIYQDPADQNHE